MQFLDRGQARTRAIAAVTRLEAHPLVSAWIDDQIGDGVVDDDAQHGLGAIGARRAVALGDTLIEQEDFDVLGTVDEQLDVDFGIAAGGSVEHGAAEVGAEALYGGHQPRGDSQ